MKETKKRNEMELLDNLSKAYNQIIKDNLVGIYIHGSIAFGCFNWEKSDIDFLVITKETPCQQEKEALIQVLLDLECVCPPKGLEMSLILEKYCLDFVYPTPFELHFSNLYSASYKRELKKYAKRMNGTDKDLAGHFTVCKQVGKVLCGKAIDSVFGEIPKSYYRDSIKSDIQHAENEIKENPISVILNLCRVLAYIKEELILSKAQGGLWGIQNLPVVYAPLIQKAVQSYSTQKSFSAKEELLNEFSLYMKKEIFHPFIPFS